VDTSQLIGKIERLRAAIGEARDADLTKIHAVITQTPETVTVRHDFAGEFTRPQVENLAWAIIRAIADLQDHVKKWAAAHGHPKTAVDLAVTSCPELAIVIDLANYDKHGDHNRNGGRSKSFPVLRNLRRGLQVSTSAMPGAVAAIQLLPTGGIKTIGDAAVVVLGEVALRDGRQLEIGYVQQRAVEAWEKLLEQFGLPACR
jgi:hypothetical protein